MANKKLKKLTYEIEALIEEYFCKKTEDCNFEGYDVLPRSFKSWVEDAISTCIIEIEYLDNEIDEKIEDMEEEREYVWACKKAGIEPGEDI